jgi:hypothetical protein
VKHVVCSLAALTTLSLLIDCASGRGSESLGSHISRLVDQATESKETEIQAFKELESLGGQAVPYLVSHLGDLRPIAERQISLSNKAPDAFEGVRHYTPDAVYDALAAILNQITGQNFVFVYNGATSVERNENRRKWVEWCRSAYPIQAGICSGENQG